MHKAFEKIVHSLCTAQDIREAVWSAMEVWMAHTCIKFVPAKPEDEDYLEFVEMHG